MNYQPEYTYNSYFNTFLQSISMWEQAHSSAYKSEQLKSFLSLLTISKRPLKCLPSIEEIKKQKLIALKYSFLENRISLKKKWTFEEKETLVWAVYYYAQINRKALKQMVLIFPTKNF